MTTTARILQSHGLSANKSSILSRELGLTDDTERPVIGTTVGGAKYIGTEALLNIVTAAPAAVPLLRTSETVICCDTNQAGASIVLDIRNGAQVDGDRVSVYVIGAVGTNATVQYRTGFIDTILAGAMREYAWNGTIWTSLRLTDDNGTTILSAGGTVTIQKGLAVGTRQRIVSTSAPVTLVITDETIDGGSKTITLPKGIIDFEKVSSTDWKTIIPSRVFDVKSFGAVGDGVVNDVARIQAVFDACTASDVVYFPSGTYLINTFIDPKLCKKIYGFGSIQQSTGNATFKAKTASYDNLEISGITFLGKYLGTAGEYSIDIAGTVGTRGPQGVKIRNCRFIQSQAGINAAYNMAITADGHQGCLISGCEFIQCVYGAVLGVRSEFFVITGCNFWKNATGLAVLAGNVNVTGNNISDNTVGIYMASGDNDSHGIISSNTINHNLTYGIHIQDIYVGAMTICNNHLFDFGDGSGYSIDILNTNGYVLRFQGNVIQGNCRATTVTNPIYWDNDHLSGTINFPTVDAHSTASVFWKTKKLTGTTNAAQGGLASVAHGLTGAKIVSFALKVEYIANGGMPHAHEVTAADNYQAMVSHDATNFYVSNLAGKSSAILSKPFIIWVTYEL